MRYHFRAIADDHGVSGARQRYLRTALLQICFFLDGMPLDHQVHRPAQPEVIEVAFQEIVLSSPINRLFRYIFVFHAAENQNRNVWRGGPQLFKRHHPSSVGHFDVYDDAAHPAFMDAIHAVR
ncbi:MAG: hypothetical protein QOG55_2489 [Acidobacteriaceae bacterium]|jgi:hypothetical protein|nr:hypothetical protein [Acidobacteriaceae bacterium]